MTGAREVALILRAEDFSNRGRGNARSHCRWCRGWRGFPSRGPPRRHRRSARRQQILDQAVRVATRAGDHFVGFFAVQFDFAAGLHILAILRRRERPRFSSDESFFNLTCLGRGLEKHTLETSSAPFSCHRLCLWLIALPAGLGQQQHHFFRIHGLHRHVDGASDCFL